MTAIANDEYAELARRGAELLFQGTAQADEEALEVAHECVALDKQRVDGYLLLTTALRRLRRHEEAVKWFKRGLEVHPDNAELLNGLKIARVSVLDDLLELDEPEPLVIRGYEDSEPSPPMQRALVPLEPAPQRVTDRDGTDLALVEANHESPPGSRAIQDQSAGSRVATVFESKFERIMGHLGLEKIARLAVVYTVTELLNLRRVSVGLGLFFLALLAQMVMHRHKLMVVSMLVVCFYRSVLKAKALALIVRWGHTSTDKLGAFTWMPRVVCVVPVVLKVIGQAKFMLFLHQDLMLSVLVASVTSILVANSRRGDAGPHAVAWGQGRHLKFAAYGTAIAYWAGYRGNVVDTLRLAAPALMDAAGIVLGSVQPDEVQECCRRAWKRLYSEIADDIQQDVDLDALFFLGLGNWVVEYWQQPTDFSIEMLARMMAESFAKLEKAAVSVFRPELNRLSEQIADNRMSSELSVLVKYLKQSLSEIPPPRWFGMMGLFAMRCPSFVALGILVVFFGVISLPLVPFLVVEAHDAQQLYRMHRDGELNDLDGLEIWLLGSPLVLVWANLKASIYCLEGTVTLSRAVATGTHIVTTAARVSRLAAFAARVKQEGFVAHAHTLPDQLEHVLTIAQDASLIAEGVKYIYESSHVQDIGASVRRWWSRDPKAD